MTDPQTIQKNIAKWQREQERKDRPKPRFENKPFKALLKGIKP